MHALRRFAILIAALFAGMACAQPFPSKPVRLVVPYPPGAPVDALARGFAETLAPLLGQPVLVETRAGANEIVAATAVAKAPADGHTLLLATDAAFTQNAFLYAKLPYDARRDFVPVSRLVHVNMVLIVRGDLPERDLRAFVARMKTDGHDRHYASAGAGGTTHLAMESLKREGGFELRHVAYKGIAPAMQDLLGGSVDALFAGATAAMGHLASGKVRVLAVSGAKRALALPEVPTFAEAGFPGTQASFYLGLAAPAGTPAALVERLAVEARKAVLDRTFLAKFVQPFAYDPVADTPAEFAAFLARDAEANAQRIRALGLKLEL